MKNCTFRDLGLWAILFAFFLWLDGWQTQKLIDKAHRDHEAFTARFSRPRPALEPCSPPRFRSGNYVWLKCPGWEDQVCKVILAMTNSPEPCYKVRIEGTGQIAWTMERNLEMI